MGYSIDFCHPETGKLLTTKYIHQEGSNIVLGGSNDCHITITWNYSKHYYKALDADNGIRWIYGKSGQETAPKLLTAIQKLGCDRYQGNFHTWTLSDNYNCSGEEKDALYEKYKDLDLDAPENASILQELKAKAVVINNGGYWKGTPGNAGHALKVLLNWALEHPTGVWSGD